MDKVTQLHIVARAIHTLECQPAYASTAEDIQTLFLHHTYEELRQLKQALIEETGFSENVDVAQHMVFKQEA